MPALGTPGGFVKFRKKTNTRKSAVMYACTLRTNGYHVCDNGRLKMEQYEKVYLYRRIVRAKLFIDAHFADRLDLDNIADQAHFSKFHFIRLFKSIYGSTPHHYLIKVRMEQARILLAGDSTVLDTSQLVGFDSATSFTAVFKKYAGKTPSEFQLQNRLKRAAIQTNPLVAIPNCFAQSHGWTK
jgi:AraC-like DNA-binding protein